MLLISCFHTLLFVVLASMTSPSPPVSPPSVKTCHLAGSVIVRERGVCRERGRWAANVLGEAFSCGTLGSGQLAAASCCLTHLALHLASNVPLAPLPLVNGETLQGSLLSAPPPTSATAPTCSFFLTFCSLSLLLPLCGARCATALSVSLMHGGAFSPRRSGIHAACQRPPAPLPPCPAPLPSLSHRPPLLFLLSISFQPVLLE